MKIDWSIDPDEFVRDSERIADLTLKHLKADGIEDDMLIISMNGCHSNHKRVNLRTLDDEQMQLLLDNSISPLPLHKTLVLLDHLRQYAHARFLKHQQLALAKALAFSISNLHFGPEVGVGAVKSDAPVVSTWLSEIYKMARDLRQLRDRNHIEATIYHADARNILTVVAPHSIDAVITSPPYPNEKDYTRTTRLESVVLGFIRNRIELRMLKQQLLSKCL